MTRNHQVSLRARRWKDHRNSAHVPLASEKRISMKSKATQHAQITNRSQTQFRNP